MDKKYLLIAAVLIAVGLIYWKFFHKRKGLAHVAKPSTPAVKKRGGGGWRHRLSHLDKASGLAHHRRDVLGDAAAARCGIRDAGQAEP